MKPREKATFFEFLIFGILLGIVEDLIAIKIITGETFTFKMLAIVILVAIPFAFLGEVIIDNINLVKFFKKIGN